MELAGDEKQIRALFSELKFADEQIVPSFVSTWHRAQSRALQPRRAFNLSFAMATALLVCALVGLALWSRQWSKANSAVVSPPPTANITPNPTPPKSEIVKNETVHQNNPRPRSIRVASRRNVEQIALAKAISNWQSPTDSLMRSPSEQVLTTLPQLNDAATQLKSFLPDRDKK